MGARHGEAMQEAAANAAADLAAARQQAADEQKELRSKLGNLSGILAPALSTVKTLQTEYRTIKTEMRDLQATIAPAVKQAKRDLLKKLAEMDKGYKEMLTKYGKEMALRKKLHNELVDLKGNIRVYARLRPKISEDGDGPDAEFCCHGERNDDQLCTVNQ